MFHTPDMPVCKIVPGPGGRQQAAWPVVVDYYGSNRNQGDAMTTRSRLRAARFAAVIAFGALGPGLAAHAASVFINELHYDNTGTDTGEAIEIAGPAGTALDGWRIVLYNGLATSRAVYHTTNLGGAIPDLGGGYGVVAVNYPVNGIQNGAPDGLALVDGDGGVVQFLSYEGSFTAADGPAAGLTSVDIGVAENGTEPAGRSLQLSGTGTGSTQFSWNLPAPATFGAFNAGQTFGGGSGGDTCGGPYTPTYAIQGSGPAAAITGSVITQGVVVGDFELPTGNGQVRGFYLQDPAGDGDPSTSDGLFVFNGNNDSVRLGDLVRVAGTAGEFQDQTRVSATGVLVCGTGTVTPTDVVLPFLAADIPERYEGMLVRLPQTLYVTEHFQLGRFGQIVMAPYGRLAQPTAVVPPGAPALAVQAANELSRIVIDDDSNLQNPDPIRFGRDGNPLSAVNTLRGGDSAAGIVGVMTYGWGGNSASGNAYRVRPLGALGGTVPVFQPANPRPAAPAVGGTLRVASFNLLNYFNTFDGRPDSVDNCRNGVGGAPTDCRGADDAAEFERQAAKTVDALVGLDADVIGLMEIENDGYGPDSAIADLVGRLNAVAGTGHYAYIDADAAGGELNTLGTDAIKVGLIYRPARVAARGGAVLNSGAFGLYTTVSEGTIGRNRPALAQTFEQGDGARFTVVVNHLKSKGSSCEGNIYPVPSDPDLGDGQGHCNLTRTAAARDLALWLATDPTRAGEADVLIIGDLNAYALEDPLTALAGGGYVNLVGRHVGAQAYSYVFDGQWGYLDHALASPSLALQVRGVAEWHINADEPGVLDYNTDYKTPGQLASLYAPDRYRASDHDPVVIDLDLDATPPVAQLTATPALLWPPHHQYVDVRIDVAATDNLDPSPRARLVAAVSSEADDDAGDGHTADDIVIVDDFNFRLRAEREGHGPGRVYTFTYEIADFAGNVTTAAATVSVPRSRGR